jgi:hypothetical protein
VPGGLSMAGSRGEMKKSSMITLKRSQFFLLSLNASSNCRWAYFALRIKQIRQQIRQQNRQQIRQQNKQQIRQQINQKK